MAKRSKQQKNLLRNQKKKKKQEKKMAWWNIKNDDATKGKSSHTTGTKKWTGYGAKVTLPIENKDPETLSVVLFSQTSLNKIAEMCLPKANGSEFQVHYRGAQFIIKHPDTNMRVVFTIPTYFFNMPQKVSTASVDFNLDEVAEISDQLAPLSFEMVKDVAKAFPTSFFESMGFEVNVRELEMGSIHRHPGNFGFSSTDMDNKAEKPGVIFRNRKCEDKIQVDSVMYIPGQECQIVTTETRIVSVEPADDDGIRGEYSEAPTMSYIIQDSEEVFSFGRFFGKDAKDPTRKWNFLKDQEWITEKHPELDEIFSAFLDAYDYQPQLIIDPSLIEQEWSYTRPATTYPKYNRHNGYHDAYDEYDDDYYGDGWYAGGRTSTKSSNQNTIGFKDDKTTGSIIRPTWRKTQTLGLLRANGIVVNQIAEIDGSASDSDIIAICKAMKMAKKDDQAIRTLFVNCAYPPNALDKYYDDLANVVEATVEPKTSSNMTAEEIEKLDEDFVNRLNKAEVEADNANSETTFDVIDDMVKVEYDQEAILEVIEQSICPPDLLDRYVNFMASA